MIDMAARHFTCLERVEGGTYKKGLQKFMTAVAFTSDGSREITVNYLLHDGTRGSSHYSKANGGSWSASETNNRLGQARLIDVTIKEDLNDPPVLMAIDNLTKRSRVLLDPNPQFKDINLGEASILIWTDKSGRAWKGWSLQAAGLH